MRLQKMQGMPERESQFAKIDGQFEAGGLEDDFHYYDIHRALWPSIQWELWQAEAKLRF